ncbi:DEAD/DEAH box helicase [Promicromonospora sp. NPDC057488]|uniref:DEAD/DEAH box helicase n=1 Tax=Promicromonospora sp. NPDC057488 TaxID=3346147 RepID=UPI00366C08A2
MTNGRQQRYVAVVCPTCPESFRLHDLGLKTARELHLPQPSAVHPVGQPAAPVMETAHADVDAPRRARVLRFWRAVEFFGAQEVKPANPGKRRYDIGWDGPLPWQTGHHLQRVKKSKPENVWRHTVYGGIFGRDRIHDRMAEVFGESGFDVDERTPRGQSALFAVEVSPDGRLLLDSFTLSQAAWALGRTVGGPGPRASDWLDEFDKAQKQFASDVEEVVQAHVDDKQARDLEEKGIAVSRRADTRLLYALVRLAAQTLGVVDLLAPRGLRVQSIEVSPRRAYEPDADFLNSFLAEDLGRVADAVLAGEAGPALATYLAETPNGDRFDVRAPQNLDAVLDMLAPRHVPPGRWPTNPEHSLATSQQLAVNQSLARLGKSAGLFGVNGPPGTGKTTMLRDLVAAQVVARAEQLAELATPAAAFETVKKGWRIPGHTVEFQGLISALTGFEMVVSSSNNGAVQNVTRELPDAEKAIDAPWKDADYLSEHATRVLQDKDDERSPAGPRAWGLVAATLGRRSNRSRFVSRLWFTPRPKEEGAEPEWGGLKDWLAEQSELVGPSAWGTSVDAFRSALRREGVIRAERQAAHEALRALPGLLSASQIAWEAVENLTFELGQVQADWGRAEAAHDEATSVADVARRRRLEHHERKPAWWETVFTLGASIRRWNVEDAPIADRQREAEAIEDAAAAALRTCRTALGAIEDRLENARQALKNAERDVSAARSVVERTRSSMTGQHVREHVPDAGWRESEYMRETFAPWLDVSWNMARTDVFLAALDLHRAFVVGAGRPMSRLLGAAMDVVQGSAPKEAAADAVRAAWQGLFLLVPVISTTFASVGRMLEQVGAEAFGWLLIDEAGQATPQAAAGAIWRARRVLAVGDPLQLEPVVTALHSAQAQLRDHHGVSDTWLPDQQSVQTLTDRVTTLGTSLWRGDEEIWVGAPLRVHRRCDEPMFSVVNDAVYRGLMIQGDPSRPDRFGLLPEDEPAPEPPVLNRPVEQSLWLDVRSDATDGNWIPAEGDALAEFLHEVMRRHGLRAEDILVVSPFRVVADEIKKIAERVSKEVTGNSDIKVGTVHVSQGKQAPVVFLVLGGSTAGARAWASGRPNLLNVAVSRAEHRLYVIGNRDAWKDHPYFSTLAGRLPTRTVGGNALA